MAEISSRDVASRLGEQEFFLRHCGTTDAVICELAVQVDHVQLQHKEKIAEVMKVRRFKKGLEKLREEAEKEFVAEQEKLDQKELDESATISFARKIMHNSSAV